MRRRQDGKTGKREAGRLRVIFGGLGGLIPDDDELEAAILSRLGESGEDAQSAFLIDYDDLPGGDD